MRIYGPNGTTIGSPASQTRRTSSTGFSLPEALSTPAEPRSATAPKAAGNIDALLALQGVEDPTERRKRSVARGRGALDVLDELKIGLLSGSLDASTVNRLRDAAANLKSSSGDPGLDAVLSEIETISVGLTVPDDPGCKKIRGELTKRLAALSAVHQQRNRDFDRAELAGRCAAAGQAAGTSACPAAVARR